MYRMSRFFVLLASAVLPVCAGTLTNISFVSNNGSFVNDTIVEGGTSPLAFTNTLNTNQPFLNNGDSTVSLSFGDYYAISFLGFGQHLGSGTVSFLLDGSPFSQNVTFPANSPGGVNFAFFNLPGGETVSISTTGLSADRIRIVADGGGLTPDGTNDAFYLFTYSNDQSAVPEPASFLLAGAGIAAVIGLRSRRLASGVRKA